MINKILLQKSKDKMENYIVNMIKSNLTDEWTYVNYIITSIIIIIIIIICK